MNDENLKDDIVNNEEKSKYADLTPEKLEEMYLAVDPKDIPPFHPMTPVGEEIIDWRY